MNVKQICDCVYYVGVNDRVTELFEGLWSLPKGVSYNSYIVKGDSDAALIDAVAIAELPVFLENIKELGINPSYLIVNHMEPDHSGSIPEIVSHFPSIKIVANKIAIGMIRGFYHLDDPELFVEVKDGDTIELGGGIDLQFFMTPMVHWPETMMTYYGREGVLFSGDAFGTFGALSGSPLDSDYDFEYFKPEMHRYYASIVGKYSPFVQKALGKLKNLTITKICSTHGPVWKDRIADVVDCYNRLSLQKSEDGVVIVYGSMYGNTERMVNKFATMLSDRGVKVQEVYNAGETELSFILADVWRYKGLVVASPTYSLDIFPPVESFIRALEIRGVKGKVVGALGSYAWAPKVAAEKVYERMAQMGLNVVGKVAMPMSLNPTTEQELENLADEFSKALQSDI